MTISEGLLALRRGMRLTDEAYEQVEWTKVNKCYCSACSHPPCSNCENGLPEDVAYEIDEYWEIDPDYEEEEMSRTDIVDKGSTTASSVPTSSVLEVGDTAVVVKVDLGWLSLYPLAKLIKTGQKVIIANDLGDVYNFKFKDASISDSCWSVPKDWLALVQEETSKEETQFPHLAHVQFYNDDGSVYAKTYSYQCDESVYKAFCAPSTTRYLEHRAFVIKHSRDHEDKIERRIRVVRVERNTTHPLATKNLPVYTESVSSKDHVHTGIPIQDHIIKTTVPNTRDDKLDANIWAFQQINELPTTKEEVNMSQVTRKVVTVQLIDQDAGLPVEFSLVEDFGSIITEDDQATTIQQLIVDNDLKVLIDLHNAVRLEQVDLDIQKRTGNTVKLQPIKLKDLTWVIK